MSRHTLTHAPNIFYGSAWHPGAFHAKRGVPIALPTLVDLGVPATADATLIVNAQAASGAADLTLAGQTLDVPRNVEVKSSATESGVNVTVYGRDEYGAAMSEQFADPGTSATAGAKAFKTIERVHVDANPSGNISVGSGNTLGLPFRVNGEYAILHGFVGTSTATITLTSADTTDPATKTSGDVRGTVSFSSDPDDSNHYRVWLHIEDVSNREAVYGVEQG